MTIRKLAVVTMVAVFAMGVYGCKKDKGDDEGKGGKGGGNLAAKFQGEWTVDFDKMVAADPKMKELDADKKKMLAGVFAKMVVKVGKDSIQTLDHEGKNEKDTYVVKSSKGKKLVVESKDEKGKVETVTVEFTSDDTIELSKEGEKDKMFMKRK